MKTRRTLALLFLLSLTASWPLKGTLVTIAMSSEGYQLFSNAAKTQLLTAGNASLNGDGAVLQLGYYKNGASYATTSNNFGGDGYTFIPIAGSGSNNSNAFYANISIGDRVANGGTSGEFWLGTMDFTVGETANFSQSIPPAGTPLVIRFFDNTTIASSTLYNAVSNDTWLWGTPGTSPGQPKIDMTLADGDSPSTNPLEWLGGNGSAFYTSISLVVPVPEASTYGLFSGLGLIVIAGFQQRRRLVAAAAGFLR